MLRRTASWCGRERPRQGRTRTGDVRRAGGLTRYRYHCPVAAKFASICVLIARWFVVFVRRAGGQSQFSAQLAVQAAERAPVRDLQAWIVEHPDEDCAIPSLARRAGMSVRHFARVFRAEVGLAPAAYVERVRLETARRLLETTAMSIDRVAEAAGFGTPESLRRAFARRIGLSPREYRNRFSSAEV
jgi:transcriptional regulator GlxA family with amidase domain